MIKQYILKSLNPFIEELRESIKAIEIEEKLDLIFHRPLGLIFSKFAIKLGLTPLHVSFLSLFSGILGGILFYWQENIFLTLLGSFILTLSAIFDSSDGQVARLTKKTTEFGRVVDGLIDNFVFVFIYFFASLHFYPLYGIWIFVLAAVSGFFNSLHSLIYDFYKNEVAFIYCGINSQRNEDIEEVKDKYKGKGKGFFGKICYFLHRDYLRKQYFFTIRKGENKKRFEILKNSPEIKDAFREKYKKELLPLMPYWALFGGTNTHRTLIMFFCIFGSFHYYLIFNLICLTIPIFILVFIQNRRDRAFLNSFDL
jgi:hypothetical protein